MSMPRFYCACGACLHHALSSTESAHRMKCDICGALYTITIAVEEKGKPQPTSVDCEDDRRSFIWGMIAGLMEAAAKLYTYSGAEGTGPLTNKCDMCDMKHVQGQYRVHAAGCATRAIEMLAEKLTERVTK